MHAIWESLKENAKCGRKLADVVALRERCDRRRKSFGKANVDGELVHPYGKETPIRGLIYPESYTRPQLFELHNGDPSRKIIEMIVGKASTNPLKPSGRIKTVLRVKNSTEKLERFEMYREKVKNMAKERYTRHTRSAVDGNELLRFYGTTMACCHEESKRFPELCNAPTCRVCRSIQSNFDTEYILENGIQLSTSSENTIPITRPNKTKRAVIICRTIAGSIVKFDGYEEFDSTGSTTDYILVQNPSAVLPCFVIVFN